MTTIVRAHGIKAFGLATMFASPVAERRWWIGFQDFVILLKGLRIKPDAGRPVSHDHRLAYDGILALRHRYDLA